MQSGNEVVLLLSLVDSADASSISDAESESESESGCVLGGTRECKAPEAGASN